ncbi:hypothetical protein [Clostridium sp. 1001271B_151109_B4]|uniref:hypothetical protein n=1 Tax=Clostridium sp. 1001271B_151109_B4 TaxID=2787148 RepID=UPI001FAC4274|nr:hypothetical protein [Clostridium sp. 1001271B_151109_B4]
MNIRKATKKDLSRIAEIYVFNNRVNYWPIFKDGLISIIICIYVNYLSIILIQQI